MSLDLFKNVIYKMFRNNIYVKKKKKKVALNNLQSLKSHKTKPTVTMGWLYSSRTGVSPLYVI